METLRIAQVAPYYHPHVGGVESHVESVAAELVRRGHEVEVWTSHVAGSARREVRSGVLVRRIPQWLNLFSTPVTPRLTRELMQARPDIVHAHSPPPLSSWFAARACRRGRIPFVLTYHCDLEIPLPGGQALVDVYRRSLGGATVRQADALIATTRTYAETSHALWRRDDVQVVPNAVDALRFSPEDSAAARVRRRHRLGEAPVALFVGRLAPHKGIEEFIRSAQWTGPDTVHVIVGDGPRREPLRRLARETAPERIVFTGRVAANDLADYYRAATVGVLPSTSRLEAFGIAALECMATGTPVILSDMPGTTEVIEHGVTGLLAEPLDPEGLGRAIDKLVHDPELVRSMGKAARERVLDRFTIQRVVDALVDVYRATAGR